MKRRQWWINRCAELIPKISVQGSIRGTYYDYIIHHRFNIGVCYHDRTFIAELTKGRCRDFLITRCFVNIRNIFKDLLQITSK